MSARRKQHQEARRHLYARRPATTSRIERMIARDRDDGVRLDRDRDRGAAARSQPDQAAAAALQRAAARRQVVPLHPDHRRPLRRRRSSSIAARARARATISARSPRPGGQPHHHRAAARVPAALLLRRLLREPHAALPAAPDQALLGALHAARSRSPTTPSWCARRRPSSPARARRCRTSLPREMEQAADALDFERAAIYRDRLAALSACAGAPGHQSAQRRGGRRLRRPPGGRLQPASRCSSSAPARTGATAPISRKADRSLEPGEVLGAFLAQFYDDKPCPRCILLSHDDRRSASCWPRRCPPRAGRKVEISVPQRGEKKDLVDHALANAREALGRKLAETSSQQQLLDGARRDASACRARRAASRSTTTATSRAPTRSAP